MKRKISNNCTGCGACFNACPKNCILMKENAFSELRPYIDKKHCVNCGRCVDICPENNHLVRENSKRCYVAWSKNDNDLVYSASGGVGAVFARYQLNNKGAFYGCDYDSEIQLTHFQVKSEEDIFRVQSSKYSQSKSYIIFDEIKKNLQNNRSVVFIGTPCQVAGLKRFLRKDYNNLVTVDLVCHGTPPNKYFTEYIDKINAEKPLDRVRFRGEFDQQLTLWKDNKVVFRKKYQDDLYFSAFYKNKISMKACYTCQYADNKRVSEITIADFWGLGELHHIEKRSNRPSLILINNEKGMSFFGKASEGLIYEERTVLEAIEGNGRLNKPPGMSIEAKAFRFVYAISSNFRFAVKFSEKINLVLEKYGRLKLRSKKVNKRLKKSIKRRINFIKQVK